jgi:carbonic anhydrase
MLAAIFSTCVLTGAAAQTTTFSYTGDAGPGFWGTLDPAWVDCATDTRQSPIDIDRTRHDGTLEPLDLELQATAIDLTNNGHTIEQAYASGSTLTFEGVEYQLLQFHFHTLSEHTVDGERGVMELHMVFDDTTGNKVVIGQLYKIGKKNTFLAQFDKILPQKNGDVTTSATQINVADGLKDT